jgi:hypothetical protein
MGVVTALEGGFGVAEVQQGERGLGATAHALRTRTALRLCQLALQLADGRGLGGQR